MEPVQREGTSAGRVSKSMVNKLKVRGEEAIAAIERYIERGINVNLRQCDKGYIRI